MLYLILETGITVISPPWSTSKRPAFNSLVTLCLAKKFMVAFMGRRNTFECYEERSARSVDGQKKIV